MKKLTQAEANQVFINSMDDKTHFSIITIEPDVEVKVTAQITTKLWDDGAPHAKYFERDDIKVFFTFKADEPVEVVLNCFGDEPKAIYWFSSSTWYKLKNSGHSSFYELLEGEFA